MRRRVSPLIGHPSALRHDMRAGLAGRSFQREHRQTGEVTDAAASVEVTRTPPVVERPSRTRRAICAALIALVMDGFANAVASTTTGWREVVAGWGIPPLAVLIVAWADVALVLAWLDRFADRGRSPDGVACGT